MCLVFHRNILLPYLTLLGLLSLFSCDHKKLTSTELAVEFTSGDIPQEVYVWQRVWTDEVKSAVETRAPEFHHTVILAAEIAYERNQWTFQPFHSPLNHAQQNPEKYSLAFRINAKAADTKWSDSANEQIAQYLQPYLKHTKSIQIDYDCPTNKLADYTKLITYLKKEFPSKMLEITCLPDWLNNPDFELLIEKTDRYIMQVHGVSGRGKGYALCNPDHALSTALKCAVFQKPYLIALPTYRHAISYDDKGKITSVASEGHYQTKSYEITSADPQHLSQLILQWQKQRPALMQGVIWYRLPVNTDRMNWTWETLQKVRRGDTVEKVSLDLTLNKNETGLHQLMLTNNSTQRIDYPEIVKLEWQGFCIASHLTDHFLAEQFDRTNGISIHWKKNSPYPIAPGESILIGSFRFAEKPTSIEISTP